MAEAAKQFCRVNGHFQLPALQTVLNAQFEKRSAMADPAMAAAPIHLGPLPTFHGTRDMLASCRPGGSDHVQTDVA
jgi:hypothetical protein